MSKPSRSEAAIASDSWAEASSYAAWISSRLGCEAEPPAAKWAPKTSPSRVTAVTSGRSATSARAASRSCTTAVLKSSRASDGTQGVGARHHVDGVRRVAGQPGPGARSSVTPPPSSSPARPRSPVLRWPIADTAASPSVDGHGVGRRAQRRGDRGLVAGVDGQHRRHRPEQARDGVGGGEQRAGAVLAVEAERERLGAGLEAGAVAVGLGGLLARLGQALGQVVEHGQRGLVLGVEALLAGVEPGDPGLEGGEVVLGAVGAGDGRRAGRLEPSDLLLGRGGARLDGVDLAGEPGQALAAVGGGAQQARDAAVLLGRRLLGGTTGGHRGLERGPVGLDLGGDHRLLLADAARLGLELVGVATQVERLLLGPGGVAHALGGERRRTAQPLAHPRQPEPGLLCPGQRGQVVAQRRLEPGLGLLRPARPPPRPPPGARPGSTRRRAPAGGRCGR